MTHAFPAGEPLTFGLLFAVALLASALDAIAGGGGLLTLPSLLLAGLDPVSALATNKLQSSFGSASATALFLRRGMLVWPMAWSLVAAGIVFAALGALSVALLPPALLKAAVPLLLIAIAIYFALAPSPGALDVRARLPGPVFALVYVAPVAFYDGIFGPGTGSFLMAGFVAIMGFGFVKATAHTKLANASSNIGALVVFAAAGRVVWPVGLVMAAGAVVGGQIGSRLALRHGARLIRPLLVVICCTMAIKLLADPDNPIRRLLAGGFAGAGP